MFPPEYKAGIACSIACVGILDSEWTLATWTEWVWSLCCIQLSVHSRTCLGRMSVGPQTSKIMQSWTKVLQNVLAFLAGLFLNRTSPATPGPTQLWTSVTVFPVVCGFFFFFWGGGGVERTALFFQMVALFYDATQGASHRSLRISDHCTVPRAFQGCGTLHSHNNLPHHTRLFTGKEKEAALADKTLRRVACKGDQWNASWWLLV